MILKKLWYKLTFRFSYGYKVMKELNKIWSNDLRNQAFDIALKENNPDTNYLLPNAFKADTPKEEIYFK